LPRGQLGRVPAHVDADRHRGEDARDPRCHRWQVGEVAAHEGDRDRECRILNPAPHLPDDHADAEADGDPTDDVEHEAARGLAKREGPADHRDDGELVRDEGGAIVHEALAFDEGDKPARKPDALGDCSCGCRIGGGDHRPEHEGDSPAQAGDEHVRDDCDDDHRAEDEPDREECDGKRVLAEVSKRGEEGGSVEERWQHRDEDEIGRQLDVRDSRDEPEPDAADHEQNRIRNTRPLRRDEQQRDGDENGDEREAFFGREGHSTATRTLD
jgi:hypothetical protein